MNINYALAREIYGSTPWCVDSVSLPALLGILKDAKNGNSLAAGEGKNNTPYFASLDSELRIVTSPFGSDRSPGQLDNNDDFDAIGIIQIDGPITNNGGASSYGMIQLSAMMKQMANDKRVKSFIVYGDSGGGSAFAVETMQDAILEVRAMGKDVVFLVRKGGMACSAMYMIASSCSSIYVENEMSLVGSNGTMISFSGYAANSESPDGEKRVEVYATKSTEKNNDFREALNNDNYQLLIDNMLDPINERALSRVLGYRPQLEGSNWDTGISIFAKDGIGTYVDGVKSFSELVNELNLKINYKSNNMTIEQLRNEHPDVYSEVLNKGIAQESDRVGSWLAHHDTDSTIVIDGIKSGKEITATAREQLLVKSTSKSRFEQLESATEVIVTQPESETPPAAPKKEANAEEERIDNAIKAAFGFKK